MSKIRSQNTEIENIVFRELTKKRICFQKHYKKVAGNPDIALSKQKKAVFIDGDFWHGYQFSKLKKRLPRDYWLKKIEGNIKRDKRNAVALKRIGWQILRIWEHKIQKRPAKTLEKIMLWIKK